MFECMGLSKIKSGGKHLEGDIWIDADSGDEMTYHHGKERVVKDYLTIIQYPHLTEVVERSVIDDPDLNRCYLKDINMWYYPETDSFEPGPRADRIEADDLGQVKGDYRAPQKGDIKADF